MTSQSARPIASERVSVASVVVSMTLIGVGNGLLFAYIPVRLAAAEFPPATAGLMLTALSAGGIAGCLSTGWLVRRVGHARAFMALAALISLTVVAIAFAVEPWIWVGARGLYGVAIAGLFIVSQSWINDAVEAARRGRVIAFFYMAYIVSIGLGGYLVSAIRLESGEGPLVGLVFILLGILPVGLTRLPSPPPPEAISVAIGKAWAISPVAVLGMLSVGGLTMFVQGFTPIYLAESGAEAEAIGLVLLLMPIGMIVVQYPIGWLSDRIDRRYALLLSAGVVILAAALATQSAGWPLALLVVVFALWSGATESIYSVANAHANDWAEPKDYVALSSTLLIAWSVSGAILPAIATALTEVYGPRVYMTVAIAVAGLFAAFVAFRLTRRKSPPEAAQEPFQQMSAQAPLTPEFSPYAPEAAER